LEQAWDRHFAVVVSLDIVVSLGIGLVVAHGSFWGLWALSQNYPNPLKASRMMVLHDGAITAARSLSPQTTCVRSFIVFAGVTPPAYPVRKRKEKRGAVSKYCLMFRESVKREYRITCVIH